jgi:hypothetical protein
MEGSVGVSTSILKDSVTIILGVILIALLMAIADMGGGDPGMPNCPQHKPAHIQCVRK